MQPFLLQMHIFSWSPLFAVSLCNNQMLLLSLIKFNCHRQLRFLAPSFPEDPPLIKQLSKKQRIKLNRLHKHIHTQLRNFKCSLLGTHPIPSLHFNILRQFIIHKFYRVFLSLGYFDSRLWKYRIRGCFTQRTQLRKQFSCR